MTLERWQVPQSWAWTTASEVADIVGGGTPPSKDNTNFAEPGSGIPWIGPADLTGYKSPYIRRGRRDLSHKGLASSGATIMPAGAVLFSSRAPIGYCAIAADNLSTNQGFKSWVCAKGVSPEYVRHYLLSSVDYVDSLASGTTFREVSGKRVAGMAFPVAPAAEQRRIVAKLNALTARLARARAELDRVPVLAAKLRHESYSRLWSAPSRRGLGSLLAEPVRNGLSVAGTDQPPGVPALRLSALRGDRVNLNDVRFLPITEDRAAAYRLRRHDLLVSRGNGTLSLVGKAALVVAEDKGVLPIFPDTAFRIRVDTGTASPKWLLHVWNSPQLRYQIEAVARTTAGIWKIAQRDLMSLAFPDVKVEAQREVAARVEADLARADRIEAEAARARALLDRFEAAILAKAFRGELVPQDPNDEPAGVLLERIRAQRAAAPKAKRVRRANTEA